jgi:hypothetical protein
MDSQINSPSKILQFQKPSTKNFAFPGGGGQAFFAFPIPLFLKKYVPGNSRKNRKNK